MRFHELLLTWISTLRVVLSCPDSDATPSRVRLTKRAEGQDWAYESSYNWHTLNENYTLCQTGDQQSPIPLLLTQGLSLTPRPMWTFPDRTNGTLYNWGYGPAFSLQSENPTANPSVVFQDSRNAVNETVYLKGWHIHAPADHSVQNDRSKGELHFVYGTAQGKERAVFAIRLDPGNSFSPFFKQIPSLISFRELDKQIALSLNLGLAFSEVNNFAEFWTYRGSLTSPPCTQGIRWFVARNILFVSGGKMQDILRVSAFSARQEQEVWQHELNSA